MFGASEVVRMYVHTYVPCTYPVLITAHAVTSHALQSAYYDFLCNLSH